MVKKKARPKLLGAIDRRRPKRGEAKLMGKTEWFNLSNADIARMQAGEEIARTDPIEACELGTWV